MDRRDQQTRDVGRHDVPVPETLRLRDVRLGLRGPITDVEIRDGVVAAIGEGTVPGVQDIDGRGGTLLPGLRDQHVHMMQWATGLQRVDLAGAASAAAAVHRLVGMPGSDLLWGRNFRDGLWPDAPHKDLLEAALPGRPVALVSNDLHSIWLSPAALKLIGTEHPTGLLRESQCFEAIRQLPAAGDSTVDGWVLDAADLAAARGVTSILDFEFDDTITAWERRHRVRRLPIRVQAAIYRPLLPQAIEERRRTGDIVEGTEGLVTVGPCKVLIDGSLNTRTAYCHHRYPGSDTHGLLTADPVELTASIATAARHGISFAVHAIGDAANQLALNCFRDAGATGRIEHAQLVDDADLVRFAGLGVIASIQPGHAPEDRDVADTHWAGLTSRAFPYGALQAAGATLELGSDAPVSRLDPWHAIASAVFRSVDERPAWHPENALTIDEAIAASTGGRTAPTLGMVADLVLTELDPVTADRSELDEMPVQLTLLGGRISYHT